MVVPSASSTETSWSARVSMTVPRSVRTRTVGMTLWVLSIVVVKNAEPKVAMTLPMATPVSVLPNPR